MEIIIVNTYPQLNECLAIRHKVFVEEQGVPKELEYDAYDESPEACGHILLKYNGTPAATGRWIFYKAHTSKLQRLSVLVEFRGMGAGRTLVEALEQQARAVGNTSCILDSQCHAESFYAKLGYLTISEKPFEDCGIMHVRMQKLL